MYIVINKSCNTRKEYKGSFPQVMLEDCLNRGEKLIVISHYSNTIKVPHSVERNGIVEWDWEDYIIA